ncbi:hypothetical protein [Delftia acidovorans]|uniref:hypothetical protein n=1 Tax=Delftia acidovorans TaxID=80866 RepID=UPI000F4B71E4|nr:hypothetical protein [Delftia acidovorans]
MQATVWETFLFVAPLPIIGVTIFLLSVRRKRQKRAAAKSAHNADALATIPIGKELSERTAELLQQGLQLCYRHRDYCGMGLREFDGTFVYGTVVDGHLLTPRESQKELAAYPNHRDERTEFQSAELFITWLSQQCDASLAGDGNQRLTRTRLLKAHDFCRNNPQECWPGYAG